MTGCPLDDCPTQLQRTVAGDLVDGVASHLHDVHQVEPREAVRIARDYLDGKRRRP